MKILQICPKPPFPPIDGGCAASLQLSREIMQAGYQLDVISMATPKHPFIPEAFEKDFLDRTRFKAVKVDSAVTLWKLLKNLFREKSNWEERFTSDEFTQMILNAVESIQYDYIIFDGLMTTTALSAVRENTKANVLYRSHNIEADLPAQLAKNSGNPIKKAYLTSQAKRLKHFEEGRWKMTDGIISISFRDTRYIMERLENKSKVITLPFSVNAVTESKPGKRMTVFHLGSMEWRPNVEGMRWFLKEVWPMVIQRLPDATLHLGGKSISDQFTSDDKLHVVVHPEVTDATEFMSTYEVMVVPIKVGSGIRIKVLEGMALGKVIVSTEIGIDGIACQHDSEVLLAENPEDFARHIIQVLTDTGLRDRVSKSAQELIRNQYLADRNIEKLKQVFEVMFVRQS